MEPAIAAAKLAAFARERGTWSDAAKAWECMVDSGKSVDEGGPWLPYVRAYALWPDAAAHAAEVLEWVDGIYDKTAFTFSNNFIATFGGTDNATALWSFLAAPMARIELRVEGVRVRYAPAALPPPRGSGAQAGSGAAAAASAGGEGGGQGGGRVELVVLARQAWHLPRLLLLARAALGPAVRVRVESTLAVDPASGRVTSQHDRLDNWPSLPLLLRLLLGAFVPLLMAVLRPF